MFEWLRVAIGPIVSIVAIFISNWLGQRATFKNYKLDTQKQAYLSYYVPLMKILTGCNKENLTYFWLVCSLYMAPEPIKNQTDRFLVLLKDNLEYLPPKVANMISEYSVATGGAQLFFGDNSYREKYRHNLVEASKLFDEIIEISLKEARQLSKTLGYPDIAQPILEAFLKMEQTRNNHPRWLPEIYQTHSPRLFVGDEHPYY